MTLSGLPSLAELSGAVSPSGILPKFLQQQVSVNFPDSEPKKHQDCGVEALPASTSSAQPLRRTADSGRVETSQGAKEEPKKPTPQSGKRDGPSLRSLGKELSAEAFELLRSFPEKQVIKSKGVSWPPTRAGFLDLYSGEKGVAKKLTKLAPTWSLCFDLEDGPEQDLNCPEIRIKLLQMVKAGCFIGVGGGPVCSSFSMAVRPPVRSRQEPFGKADITPTMKVKVEEGNSMCDWFFKILEAGLELNLAVWMENPAGSWMFRLPTWLALQNRWPELRCWIVDYCRYGMQWRKRTKIFSNTLLRDWKTLCKGGHEHLLLKGRSKVHRMCWTRVAQAYPEGVSAAISRALAMQTDLIATDRDFDPSSCARCGHRRIGEAGNPGPRKPRATGRTGLLEEFPLVEARTLALQDKIWSNFLEWLSNTLSSGASGAAMAHPYLLVLFAKEYGNHLYAAGRSLFVYRHFLVFLQQNFLTIKPYMPICWSLVTRWEMLEPTVHRTPLPFAIFKAMVTVGLSWKWYRFIAILVLGFLGIARPGEPLAAFRKELILPVDLLSEDSNVLYLKILKPKTRHRGGGVIQHISLHDKEYIQFLTALYDGADSEERLFNCSGGSFRRRWDAILSALQIPKSVGLTPGGVRGGGCVHAFQNGLDLPRLLWKMRIKHLQTLESYLQECTASTVVPELPRSSRDRVRAAAAMTSVFLRAATNAMPCPSKGL